MISEAQILARRRATLLRDLAGARVNLAKIKYEILSLGNTLESPRINEMRHDIPAFVLELAALDDTLRSQWNYKPRITYAENPYDNITHDN